MIWIYPEQLFLELQKELKSVYLLLGNDSYLLQESYLSIIKAAKILNFNTSINVELDIYSDWKDIFNLFKTSSLFEKRKIFSLKFTQNYPVSYFKKNIPLLFSLLHNDLVLIIYIQESNQISKNNIGLQYFDKKGIFVDCSPLTYGRMTTWIENQAKHMKLVIENLACQLLCYYYEGSLIFLHQVLQNLSLIYPDGNLNFIRVKKVVTDSACFNVNHWIEAILIGKKQRADRILRQLKYMEVDLEALLRKIKSEVLMIINIKYGMAQRKSLFSLLKQYKVYKEYRHMLLSRAVKRLSLFKLYQSLELLVQIELRYKKDYISLSWSNFEVLSALLCYDEKTILNI
ncbi:DNA polymerase III subunit delta [Blochmannia endosymbiont of Camponotus sp.]|uniref:DNA polymerase III subunit delta n=1 Tax=Blochmannia endosymbiont of Camponotus sp. TaxID=700220 RepID=UPI00202403C6|nr:DNA polymerase III subunit delta [Blochmannia endosymbiont of Camponotus sp.]URJ30070.1 DNA polymerase III subunit delta [Blochmannia endosymbiont of Camponotus sp.]URJ31035.1 DNA polymerase III subunit delta [Blochmannia endosymbiont of Camponotus sp.]